MIAESSASSWDGEFLVDDGVRAEIGDDFGQIVRHEPAAVLRAGWTADVAALLRIAAAHGMPVAARGMGHSTYGQSQVAGGIADNRLSRMRRVTACRPMMQGYADH